MGLIAPRLGRVQRIALQPDRPPRAMPDHQALGVSLREMRGGELIGAARERANRGPHRRD